MYYFIIYTIVYIKYIAYLFLYLYRKNIYVTYNLIRKMRMESIAMS